MASNPTSRATELSALIASNTAILDKYNADNGLPPQSFGTESLVKYPYPPEVEAAKIALVHASDELRALIGGPIELFTEPYHNHQLVHQLIYKYNLATSFPEGKDRATYDEIAQKTGLSEPEARRIIRFAMTYFIFTEAEPGVVAHTVASKFLADSEIMRQTLGMVTEELWPAAAHLVESRAKWHKSQEPTESAYQVAHRTDQHLFNHMAAEVIASRGNFLSESTKKCYPLV